MLESMNHNLTISTHEKVGDVISREDYSQIRKLKKDLQRNEAKEKWKVDPILDAKFDARETLNTIKTLSHELRRDALEKLKYQLSERKKVLTTLQKEIFELIGSHPCYSMTDFTKLLKDFDDNLGPSPEGQQRFNDLIESFAERNKKIETISHSFPDDKDLFSYFFNNEARGQIEVVRKPIVFIFYCHNTEDYIVLYKQIYQRKYIAFVDTETVRRENQLLEDHARVSMGCASEYYKDGVVIGINLAEGDFTQEFLEQVCRHEEQHVIYDLLLADRAYRDHVNDWWLLMETLNESADLKHKQLLLRRFLRRVRLLSEEHQIKNEILAFCYNKPNTIYDILTNHELYRDIRTRDCNILRNKIPHQLSEADRKLIETQLDYVFKEDYDRVIRKAIDTINRLKAGGYDVPWIIALLETEPMATWRKVANKILES